jgi:hypothetical protein
MRMSTGISGRKTTARVAIGIASAVASLTVLAGAASADSAWFGDRHRDILASNDIHRVRIVNGFDGGTKVKLVAQLRNLAAGDRVDFWIDTDTTDRGPEYRANAVANSGFLELRALGAARHRGALPGLRRGDERGRPQRAGTVRRAPALPGPSRGRAGGRAQPSGDRERWAERLGPRPARVVPVGGAMTARWHGSDVPLLPRWTALCVVAEAVGMTAAAAAAVKLS